MNQRHSGEKILYILTTLICLFPCNTVKKRYAPLSLYLLESFLKAFLSDFIVLRGHKKEGKKISLESLEDKAMRKIERVPDCFDLLQSFHVQQV